MRNSSHHLKAESASVMRSSDQILTLVGTRVLEEDNLALLEVQTRLLSEEQVRSLNNVLEVRLALGVHEGSNIRDVNGFGSIRNNQTPGIKSWRERMGTFHHTAQTNRP